MTYIRKAIKTILFTFLDLDECKLKNGGCHSNATCTNSIGSFSCACKQGFVGDGKAECNGKSKFVLYSN